jgi:hypothetical protein
MKSSVLFRFCCFSRLGVTAVNWIYFLNYMLSLTV